MTDVPPEMTVAGRVTAVWDGMLATGLPFAVTASVVVVGLWARALEQRAPAQRTAAQRIEAPLRSEPSVRRR